MLEEKIHWYGPQYSSYNNEQIHVIGEGQRHLNWTGSELNITLSVHSLPVQGGPFIGINGSSPPDLGGIVLLFGLIAFRKQSIFSIHSLTLSGLVSGMLGVVSTLMELHT